MRANEVIDGLEKLGRAALWMTLAAICVAVPLGLRAQAKDSARAGEQAAAELKAEKARQQAREEAEKDKLLSISTMGSLLTVMRDDDAQIWFTNVSPRHGFVCVVGRATGATGSTDSLAACQEVQPFSSASIKLMFAGAVTAKLCKPTCELAIGDAKLGGAK